MDVVGEAVAELSLVPSLFVSRTMTALHRADTRPTDERIGSIVHAAKLFATGTLDGQSVEDYNRGR